MDVQEISIIINEIKASKAAAVAAYNKWIYADLYTNSLYYNLYNDNLKLTEKKVNRLYDLLTGIDDINEYLLKNFNFKLFNAHYIFYYFD